MHSHLSEPKPYHRTKMMWYFNAIIDWMIANPGRPLSELAAHIGRAQSTLSSIINSDMFKAHYAARRAEFESEHDFGIITKVTKVANASLDAMLVVLEKKKDQVPLPQLVAISDSALSRLGYGVKPQGPQLNFQVNGNGAQVVLPGAVTQQDLLEARMAVRAVEAQKLQERSLPRSQDALSGGPVTEAEVVKSGEAASDVPATLPA